jgi:hypothetical protein
MSSDAHTPAKYQRGKVETVIFDIAVERRRISTDALIAEVISDPGDEREMKVARQAISSMRECGVLQPDQGDGMLEPTPAAVKAAALRI